MARQHIPSKDRQRRAFPIGMFLSLVLPAPKDYLHKRAITGNKSISTWDTFFVANGMSDCCLRHDVKSKGCVTQLSELFNPIHPGIAKCKALPPSTLNGGPFAQEANLFSPFVLAS